MLLGRLQDTIIRKLVAEVSPIDLGESRSKVSVVVGSEDGDIADDADVGDHREVVGFLRKEENPWDGQWSGWNPQMKLGGLQDSRLDVWPDESATQEIDKLKVLLDSLASSTSKAEKRISDHRHQKEEALKFRVAKTSEVGHIEKELTAEISTLEKQRDELEAELKRVNISLSAALARLHNNREEIEQFDEASNQLVAHLKTKEDELSRSIISCRVEADVVKTWINFLEDTWVLQSSYIEQKDEQAKGELKKYGDYFVHLVVHHLSAYKEELRTSIIRIRKFVENLKNLNKGPEMASGIDGESSPVINPRTNLEEEYLEYETKIVTTFSVVDHIKEQFYAQHGKVSRKDDGRINDLFSAIEMIRNEFDSIERPNLGMENPPSKEATSPVETSKESQSHSKAHITETPKEDEKPVLPMVKTEQLLDPEAELANLESEFGEFSKDYSTEEIGGWEFDELENELKSGDSAATK
ncbi:centrosomal protein of -like protein [Thalictrum thalictroides]|uniref:Centrosomal protein of -like protein n=1 Tax=Thalictrum thalictroides TaxID=46969 RepID=A0A7J6WXN1_THATH|nr:centrosomal protein of -like protein [Thalictrum thalictroides]